MELVQYKTEYGIKAAFIAEEGRKWMTVLLLNPEVKAQKVSIEERKYMKPLKAKNPGKVFRRHINETTPKKVRQFLRGVK